MKPRPEHKGQSPSSKTHDDQVDNVEALRSVQSVNGALRDCEWRRSCAWLAACCTTRIYPHLCKLPKTTKPKKPQKRNQTNNTHTTIKGSKRKTMYMGLELHAVHCSFPCDMCLLQIKARCETNKQPTQPTAKNKQPNSKQSNQQTKRPTNNQPHANKENNQVTDQPPPHAKTPFKARTCETRISNPNQDKKNKKFLCRRDR